MPKKDENSTDQGNPAYVGVDPMYQNHAYDVDTPMLGEDNDEEAAIVEKAQATEEANKVDPDAPGASHLGYASDVAHPTEAVKPADAHIDQNRAIMAGQVAAAEAAAAEAQASAADAEAAADEAKGEGTGNSPLGS